jgi:hypothetical protein
MRKGAERLAEEKARGVAESGGDVGGDSVGEEDEYVGRFLRLSNRVEKRILQGIVILFLLLMGIQALLTIDAVRERIVEVERLEGRSYGFAPSPERVLY